VSLDSSKDTFYAPIKLRLAGGGGGGGLGLVARDGGGGGGPFFATVILVLSVDELGVREK
jgi:hypothetical protein